MSLKPNDGESAAEFLARVESARDARRAVVKAAHDMQRAIDLAAIDEIEAELGDSAVALLELPFVEGMPCLLAVRCPSKMEVKRYRETNKIKKGEVDAKLAVDSAEQLGRVCLVYPKKEADGSCPAYDAILEVRPSVASQLGLEALKIGQGRAVEDAKS